MTKRLLSLMATLALLACGDPFAPEPASNGPALGAVRVSVDMPGNGTFDYNGFMVSSPFFALPFEWYGGTEESPGLPAGLEVTVGFERLVEWCHPSPLTRTVTITRDDTVDVAFTVSCGTIRRPVRFIAFAPPTTTAPVGVVVTMPGVASFTVTSDLPRVEMVAVNDYAVGTTVAPPCTRAPTDTTLLHVPLYPSDTIPYVINLNCN